MTLTQNLIDLLAVLKNVDLDKFDAAELAPLATATKNICEFAGAVHAQIETRALINGEALPGVVVKPIVTNRKWNDVAVAADLAFGQFGLKAFKLESPAAIEKLGDEGKALVAVASFKPEAGKRVVY